MSIAVNVNDPGQPNAIANNQRTSGNGDLTSQNAQDLQNSFLTLLVAQLKNQDPTNPMDNSQLTSQLAQISTVSGVEKLNTTLNKISGQVDNSQSLQAVQLIGHGVMVPGNKILAGEDGTTTPFGIDLPQGAKTVVATITSQSGEVVRTLDLGALSAGVHVFFWDGKTADGATTKEGAYKLTLTASSDTNSQIAQSLNYGKVIGLISNNGNNLLDLGTMGTATINNVHKIL